MVRKAVVAWKLQKGASAVFASVAKKTWYLTDEIDARTITTTV